MNERWSEILPREAVFDRADAAAFFGRVPAKWCVALLIDAAGRPLQLLCAKNLRAMLRRRLAEPDAAEPAVQSKRVDYRELVARVAWRRVDGELEMDLVYVDAAHAAFPAHWRRLTPEREAHFVRIDADEPYPDFVRTDSIEPGGQTWGPFPDRSKADRWIEAARDAFDLCRYRNILAQSPKGKACAYKQMNKCPAPCDGTIAFETYRDGVRAAVASLRSPDAAIAKMAGEMKRLAANLEFEQAAKIKARLATLEQLRAGAYAGVRPIESFRFLSVQPGPRKGTARLFLVTAQGVAEAAGIIDAGATARQVMDIAAATPIEPTAWPLDVYLGTICHHLGGTRTASRFVAAVDLDDARLAEMLRQAMKGQAASETAESVRETRLEV